MAFKMELVCCEETILNEINQKEMKKDDIALTYYFCILSSEKVSWYNINTAIVKRWKRKGLDYIKKKASGLLSGKDTVELDTSNVKIKEDKRWIEKSCKLMP